MRVARRVVEPAISEHMDGTALEKPTKSPATVALGKLGGAKGGAGRCALAPEAIGTKAAQARWAKP